MQPLLLKSKLSMPKLEDDVLWRSALAVKLGNISQYSVATVFAGAGYGKTTAVVQALTAMDIPCCWYNPGPEDDNIFAFSTYLAGALDRLYPGFKDWYFANIETEKQFNWKNTFSVFMAGMENYNKNAAVLVVDDWHLVDKDTEIQQFFDRFLVCKPDELKVILLSREKINLPEIVRLQVNGKLLEIQDINLMFSYYELYELVRKVMPNRYTEEDVRHIYDVTEGWIMAIRLFTNYYTNGLRQSAGRQEDIRKIDTLFEYLARDVLIRQPDELQNFLLKSALLDSFTAKVCKYILGLDFKYEYLEATLAKGLFLTEVGKGTYRYHQLFREFLMQEAEKRIPDLNGVYIQAGFYYLHSSEPERALQYFISGGDANKAIEILCKISRDLVHSGRSRMMHQFLRQIPESNRCPDIIMALADEARFSCRYKNAIKMYEEVADCYRKDGNGLGESMAYLGIGETYLDIIQPLQAQKFLRRAYKVLPEKQNKEKTAILSLMAENMVNQGNPKRAERYRRLARNTTYFEDKNNLEARILLRTGRIHEVIRLKEKEIFPEHKIYHAPRSFRESSLILAVCYAYAGQCEQALAAARQGIEMGEKLSSPFVSAVGYARLGHALLIQENPDKEKCWDAYRQSWDIGSQLDIPRSITEVLQGRSLLYALEGNWNSAKQCALNGIEITEKCCDRWFTAVLYHTLGMSAALCRCFIEAETYLRKGNQLFQLCGDHFGQAAAAWWFTYIAYHNGNQEIFTTHFYKLLTWCNDFQCDFLLKKPSLLGDINNFTSAPFFKMANQWGLEMQSPVGNSTVLTKLPAMPATEGCGKIRIQVLGNLKVWFCGKEITENDWKRENSRHLFTLLLASRHAPLHKETLMAYLWPEADSEAANRNFKVALNNLMMVLEPGRLPRQPSSFIKRQGTIYQFNLHSQYELDADEFEKLLEQAAVLLRQHTDEAEQLLQRAINLYQGDFLGCDLQNELFLAERERLSNLFIHALEDLANLCIQQQRYENALHWIDVLLRHDKCWEQAYQLKIQCYGRMQNIPMVVRTYKKCCSVLQEELCVRQSAKTTEIYHLFVP